MHLRMRIVRLDEKQTHGGRNKDPGSVKLGSFEGEETNPKLFSDIRICTKNGSRKTTFYEAETA